MGERKGFGDRSTHAMLEERFMQIMGEMNDKEFGYVLYAFSSRGFGSE